jgi:hypothetical protein
MDYERATYIQTEESKPFKQKSEGKLKRKRKIDQLKNVEKK